MNKQRIILHLSLLEKVGPATIDTIVTACGDDIHNIYDWHASDFMRILGGAPERSQDIVTGLANQALLDREVALLEKHNLSYITCADNHYPALLREIYRPPSVLYIKGAALDNGNNSLAVVGSRKANAYAKQVIDLLVPPLVYQGWTIVSGGALGADAMAHQATVDAGGVTVVVLGSGILNISPRTNMRLFDQIVAHGGTLVSPFALQAEGLPGNFPARNRVIAGLSRGCIVVQAAEQSGARITANFALEQGREVFAVPGPITDELSLGCHALLRDGATAVSGIQDITRVFGDLMPNNPNQTASDGEQLSIDQMGNEPCKNGQSLEETIVVLCQGGKTLDDLLVASEIEPGVLQALLCDLQMSGRIEQNFTGQWTSRRY